MYAAGVQLVEENPAHSIAAKPPKPPGSGSSSTATKRKDKTVISSHYTSEAVDPHDEAVSVMSMISRCSHRKYEESSIQADSAMHDIKDFSFTNRLV